MASSLRVDQIKAEASEVLRVARDDDHSDVGTEICQQKTMEHFVNSLPSMGLELGEDLERKLLALSARCCFHSGKMSSHSEKALKIAKAFSSFTFASGLEAIAYARSVVDDQPVAARQADTKKELPVPLPPNQKSDDKPSPVLDKTKALAKAVIDLAASPGGSAMSAEAVHAQKKTVKLFFESLRLDKELKAQLIALKNQCVFQVGVVNASSEKVLKIAKAFFSYSFKDEAAAVAFIRGVVDDKSAAPAKDVSFVALYEFCKPAFVGGGTAAQAQKYIAADFSLTEDPSKQADVFSLILNLQQRIHAFKLQKGTNIYKEMEAIDKIFDHLLQLPSARNVKIKELFYDKLQDLVSTQLIGAIASNSSSKKGKLVVQNAARRVNSSIDGYDINLAILFEIRSFVHDYSRYARVATEFSSHQKAVSFFFFSFSPLEKTSSSVLELYTPTERKDFSSKQLDEVNRYRVIAPPKTFEGVAFLFRWFQLQKDNSSHDQTKVSKTYDVQKIKLAHLTPQKITSQAELAKFKAKYVIHTNPEVAMLARGFVKFNIFIQSGATHSEALKKLGKAYETVRKHMKGNLPGLEVFLQFIHATGPHILRLNPDPDDKEMELAKSHLATIASELTLREPLINAYYTYLYRDLQWDAQLRKVKKECVTPEKFKSIELVSVSDSLDEEEAIKKNAKEVNRRLAELGVSLPEIDEKAGDRKDHKTALSSNQDSASPQTAATAAQKPQKVVNLFDQLVAEVASRQTAAAPAEKPQVALDPIDAIVTRGRFKDGIHYHSRVLKWFESPLEALKDPKYATKPAHVQKKIQQYHAYSEEVDRFIGTEYSIETPDPARGRIQYSFLAQITMEGASTSLARIDYTFNSQTMVCFHRCITEKSLEELMNNFGIFEDNSDFSTSEQNAASNTGNKKKASLTIGQAKMRFSSDQDLVLIDDGVMQIELMRFR
jgi:hypothetical protein